MTATQVAAGTVAAGFANNWRSLLALFLACLDMRFPGIAKAIGPDAQDAILAAATLYAAVDRFAIAHEKRSKAQVLTAQITKAKGVMGQ